MRIALILAGVGALVYGVYSALGRPLGELFSAAVWFGGGIALHDAVFAPLCLAAWFLLLRRAPVWISAASFLTVVLVLIAIPVLPREGSLPNASVLDRDYAVGLLVAISLVWVVAAGLSLRGARKTGNSRYKV